MVNLPKTRFRKLLPENQKRTGHKFPRPPPLQGRRRKHYLEISEDAHAAAVKKYIDAAERHHTARRIADLQEYMPGISHSSASREKAFRAIYGGVSIIQPLTALKKEMLGDLRGKKNQRVFGFGVGYGPFLFDILTDPLLRKKGTFDPKGVGGLEKYGYQSGFTRRHGLKILHGVPAEEPELLRRHNLKPANVTYSVRFLNAEVIGEEQKTLHAIAENISRMTARGGYSYHLVDAPTAMTKELFEKHGLKEISRRNVVGSLTLIKLRKPPLTPSQPQRRAARI